MKRSRRLGMENAPSRTLLVEAADSILIEEGALAISARQVAERAGLKPQLVHYYFETMDDLLIAVFRRAQEQYLQRHEKALASRQPLNALWKLNNEPQGTRRMMEFIVLAGRRDAVRAVIIESAEQFRKLRYADNELPLVWKHRSGRKSLVIGSTASHVVGMDRRASAALLCRLREWVTQPKFVYRHHWKIGDLILWDNTGTMHRALPYPLDCGRMMHRTTLQGEESFA